MRLIVLSLTAALLSIPAAAGPVWHENAKTDAPVVQLPSLSPLVDKVGPAVLTIHVAGTANAKSQEPLFRGFGLEFDTPPMPLEGQGSGFIIHEDGYALTNFHVIENAETIKVIAGSGREEFDAEVVGADKKTDVALIHIKADRRWPFIPLGDSDALSVGDFVVAIGNPFGLSQTVSTGIISAEHRRNIMPSGRQGLYDFLQTDASINPGNSGGPLINLKGEAIGINAAVNRAGQGLGFAIPINLVKSLLPQLKETGQVSRSWIGISIQEVTAELAQGFGLDKPTGALVSEVIPGSPAQAGGLLPGDIVTRFDGKKVEQSSDLPLLAAHAGVGKKVPLDIRRDGRDIRLYVTLGALPEDGRIASGPGPGQGRMLDSGKLGVRVRTLDDNTRRSLGLTNGAPGAYVAEVAPGSVAHKAGLRQGDVIIEVNKRPVRSARQFVQQVERVRSGRLVRVLLLRGTATVFIPLVKP